MIMRILMYVSAVVVFILSLYVFTITEMPRNNWSNNLEEDIENLDDLQRINVDSLIPKEFNKEGHKELLSDTELTCLVEAVYFEARGEPLEGKLAVLTIIINRKLSGIKKYPDTYCGVVHYTVPKDKNNKLKSCSFSYWCDGKSDVMLDKKALEDSRYAVSLALKGVTVKGLEDVVFYAQPQARASWMKNKTVVMEVGNHVFYR